MSQGKRLIVCADGTWMDADDGFTKPTLIPYMPTGVLQVPSNVTRISRALKRIGLDGKLQIIYYHSGVGTGSSMLDTLTGGLLGTGISENIREIYSFVASNYTPGDEIILLGFSRGAFTVRSVASMLRDIGLLTRAGMDSFYPIFKDQQNFKNRHYRDIFPDVPFPHKPRGSGAAHKYKRKLLERKLTRVTDPDGTEIRIQAIGVWDTVGSLGIPNIALLTKLGVPQSTKEYKFYDTNLSNITKHAFQALALDEKRTPFSPAVWERKRMDRCVIDLRQCWFPGAHSNVGGGYDDQEVANISLAWMMDQLASIGVSFQEEAIDDIYARNVEFYENPPKTPTTLSSIFSRTQKQWAVSAIYEKYKPVRPFGLGKIFESETGVYRLSGGTRRTPGLYKRADPETGVATSVPMAHTNERIHLCVRVRLELDGLGPDDNAPYKCPALLKNGTWRLHQVRIKVHDPIPWDATWGPEAPPLANPPDDLRWVWEYEGPEEDAPRERIMMEDNLGPYQRALLKLSGRQPQNPTRHKRRRRREDRSSLVDESVDEKYERRRHRDSRVAEEIITKRPVRRDRDGDFDDGLNGGKVDRRRRDRSSVPVDDPGVRQRRRPRSDESASLLSDDRVRNSYDRRRPAPEEVIVVEEPRRRDRRRSVAGDSERWEKESRR